MQNCSPYQWYNAVYAVLASLAVAEDNEEGIRKSRVLLQNPYAFLDGEGGYSAIPTVRVRDVHDARRVLENQYAYLDDKGGYSGWDREDECVQRSPLINAEQVLGAKRRGDRFSKGEIETIARRLQIALWRHREIIWGQDDIAPADILDPFAALKCLGYAVEIEESLGQYSEGKEFFEVAGFIDRSRAKASISRRFAPEIRRFTAAHELGHAILHSGSGLHRDRAIDGASGSSRDGTEAEADYFAAYFLLPEKQVKAAFEDMFLAPRFMMTEETAFALTSKNLDALYNRCRTLRDFSRLLASAEYYNGQHFHSLAKQFGVSVEAMAIRLEELNLVEAVAR